ncbi:MAG TPA: hypothetical protein VK395_19500, partial [Gemmataceae bacterium]|nr:hypothetical protein [Gemmataceae bacterium]
MSDTTRRGVPNYRKKKVRRKDGSVHVLAMVRLTDEHGRKRDIMLGEHGTAASRQEYRRVIAEWEAAGRRFVCTSPTVIELVVLYLKHAQEHYPAAEGKPSKELEEYKRSFRPLKNFYAHSPAAEFGPLALKAVRDKMIEAGLCRGVINQRMGRIRRLFRWAVANQLVKPEVLQALQALPGLQRGRSPARETEKVKPVPEAFVEATLPFLRPTLAAMVRLQLLTGMRPGELVIMRTIDLDTSGNVWLYRPGSDREHGQHKTAWRGHDRVIAIGPRGQEVLRPFLKTDLHAYLFSPAECMEAFRAEQRRKRKTHVQPSQACRTRMKPKKRPGDRYTVASYGKAITAACLKAGTLVRVTSEDGASSVEGFENTVCCTRRRQGVYLGRFFAASPCSVTLLVNKKPFAFSLKRGCAITLDGKPSGLE